MGCCESNEERGNIHMASIGYNKATRAAKGKAYNDEYRNNSFESDAATEIGGECDLFSDFSDENSSELADDTDWEDLSQDVQLERIGK